MALCGNESLWCGCCYRDNATRSTEHRLDAALRYVQICFPVGPTAFYDANAGLFITIARTGRSKKASTGATCATLRTSSASASATCAAKRSRTKSSKSSDRRTATRVRARPSSGSGSPRSAVQSRSSAARASRRVSRAPSGRDGSAEPGIDQLPLIAITLSAYVRY